MLLQKLKTKKYSHFNESQRAQLYRHLSAGITVRNIALILKVHKSSIYRELKRNKSPDFKTYLPDTAQILAQNRRNRPGSKINRSKQLQEKIQDGLAMLQSPDVIAGRLKLESGKHKISHESIYKWIYFEVKHLKLYEKLLRRKRKRGFRPCKKSGVSKIPNRISIHQRPENNCNNPGHFEGDTIHLSGRKSILTIYDTVTKVIFGSKMVTRTTVETIDTLSTIFDNLPEEYRQSITFDNGSEFTNHEILNKKYAVKTYFCDAHSPWQKGGVENANGIIRRFIPKGYKNKEPSAEEVQKIIKHINNTPRKSLGYKTPHETLLTLFKKQEIIIPLFKPFVALRL